MGMEDFQGKTAFVTGGASGIGLALGRAFADAGANIMLADIEEEALDGALAEFSGHGDRVRGAHCDVADGNAVEAAARAAIDAFGKVHVVCNNAGVGTGGPMETVGEAAWRWIIGVNLMGVVHGVRAFVPHMKQHGEPAHIVNTASMLGMTGAARLGPYCTTKFAVVGLTETLAQELAETNIGVSVLCPGWVRTRITDSARNRPADIPEVPPSAEQEEQRRQVRQLVDGGLDPGVVADRVLEGIRAGDLHIFTDTGFRPMVGERFAGILSAFEAAPSHGTAEDEEPAQGLKA